MEKKKRTKRKNLTVYLEPEIYSWYDAKSINMNLLVRKLLAEYYNENKESE